MIDTSLEEKSTVDIVKLSQVAIKQYQRISESVSGQKWDLIGKGVMKQ